MISTASIRAGIITVLKANANVTALVGDDIREESWMSGDFSYPCVRVYVVRCEPIQVSSNCDRYEAEVMISYRDAGTSSKPCADGMAVVANALENVKLSRPDFHGTELVVTGGPSDPVPEDVNAWLARVHFTTEIAEV